MRQGFDAEYARSLHHRRFASVGFGDDQILYSALSRGECGRQCTTHRTHTAIKRKLAEDNIRVELLSEKCSLAAEKSQCHRQIERGAFLADVRRREIHSYDLIGGIVEAAVAKRRLDSLAAFAHGVIGEPNHVEHAGLAGTHVHLSLDKVGVNPKHSGAESLKEHFRQLRNLLGAKRNSKLTFPLAILIAGASGEKARLALPGTSKKCVTLCAPLCFVFNDLRVELLSMV